MKKLLSWLSAVPLLVFLASCSTVRAQEAGNGAAQESTAAASTAAEDSASAESSLSETGAAEGVAAEVGDSGQAESESEEPAPLEDRAYRVRVEIGFAGMRTVSPSVRRSLVQRIGDGFRRMYGAMWVADVVESEWLSPGTGTRLSRISAEELMQKYTTAEYDKVLLLAVEGDETGFQVDAREMDLRVQELSPQLSDQVLDESRVPRIACALGRDSFRPVLLFIGRTIDESQMEFVIQAGNLTPPDPTATQIVDGDLLRPFLRQLERRGGDQVKLLQPLDLCYVRIQNFNSVIGAAGETEAADETVQVNGRADTPVETMVDRSHARGVMLSHGPVPFGGRARRTLQQIGLRQRPAAASSKVRLVLQNRPDRPLVCARVDRVQKLLQTDVNTDPPIRLISDRSGELVLEADPQHPTCWLYIYSGSILLARVPYAPGVLPADTVKLPDDSIRLGVEGELYLVRDELVDMVAEKAVNMSLARRASEERNTAELEVAIGSIEALPDHDEFGVRLTSIRAPAAQRADLTRNSAAKRRIDQLVGKMRDSIDKFFAIEKRVKEAEEIDKLRRQAGLPPAAASPPAGN